MNYILQINAFLDLKEEFSLSPNAISLYMELWKCINKSFRQNPVKVVKNDLQKKSQVSYRGFPDAFNELEEHGLVKRSVKNGSKYLVFSITPLDNISIKTPAFLRSICPDPVLSDASFCLLKTKKNEKTQTSSISVQGLPEPYTKMLEVSTIAEQFCKRIAQPTVKPVKISKPYAKTLEVYENSVYKNARGSDQTLCGTARGSDQTLCGTARALPPIKKKEKENIKAYLPAEEAGRQLENLIFLNSEKKAVQEKKEKNNSFPEPQKNPPPVPAGPPPAAETSASEPAAALPAEAQKAPDTVTDSVPAYMRLLTRESLDTGFKTTKIPVAEPAAVPTEKIIDIFRETEAQKHGDVAFSDLRNAIRCFSCEKIAWKAIERWAAEKGEEKFVFFCGEKSIIKAFTAYIRKGGNVSLEAKVADPAPPTQQHKKQNDYDDRAYASREHVAPCDEAGDALLRKLGIDL